MSTFLLYWNPHFSSYTLERFAGDFDFEESFYSNYLDSNFDSLRLPDDFDWSVYEHDKAHEGDRFIFVRVGYEKPTGVVGVGTFTSEPYRYEDWSGQGREVWYMAMDFESVIDPTSDSILPTKELQTAIPEIDWTHGKAGVMIAPETAEKIEKLWKDHLEKNVFKGKYRE